MAVTKQENKLKLLSYSFVSELPRVSNPGEAPEPATSQSLRGIQVKSGTNDTFEIPAPIKFKGNRNVTNETAKSLNYGGASGLQQAVDSDFQPKGNPLANLKVLQKYSGGNINTEPRVITGRHATVQLQDVENNKAVQNYKGNNSASFSAASDYIGKGPFTKDSATVFETFALKLPPESRTVEFKSNLGTPDTDYSNNVTVHSLGKALRDDNGNIKKDEDGKVLYETKIETIDKNKPADVKDAKLATFENTNTKLEEDNSVEFSKASAFASKFSSWSTGQENSRFLGLSLDQDPNTNMQNLGRNAETIGNDLKEMLDSSDKISTFRAGSTVDTTGFGGATMSFGETSESLVSSTDSAMLMDSKVISFAKHLNLEHVKIDKKWDTKFWKKLFSTDTLKEIGATFTDLGAEIGAGFVKSLLSATSFSKPYTNWGEITFGEGVQVSNSDDTKAIIESILGKELDNGLKGVKKGDVLSSTNNFIVTKNGRHVLEFRKSSSTLANDRDKNNKTDKGFVAQNRTQVDDTLSAVTGVSEHGVAYDFDADLESIFETDFEPDYTSHLQKIIAQDPLLSQFQYDLIIKQKTVNKRPMFPNEIMGFNGNEKGYTNYRITGITFTGNNRSSNTSHYGVGLLAAYPDLQAGADHKAELTILVDRQATVLEGFLSLAGTAMVRIDENGNTYLDLSTVAESPTWNTDTVAEILIRNGRDLRKALFLENPDWQLDEGVKVGTVKQVTGYDSGGYNPDRKATESTTSDGKKKFVQKYNLVPVFTFKNFRVINTDYNLNFKSEDSKPFEMKVTVTWSQMSMSYKPAEDIYKAEPVAVRSAQDSAIKKSTIRNAAIKQAKEDFEKVESKYKELTQAFKKAGKEQRQAEKEAAKALKQYTKAVNSADTAESKAAEADESLRKFTSNLTAGTWIAKENTDDIELLEEDKQKEYTKLRNKQTATADDYEAKREAAEKAKQANSDSIDNFMEKSKATGQAESNLSNFNNSGVYNSKKRALDVAKAANYPFDPYDEAYRRVKEKKEWETSEILSLRSLKP